MPWSSKPVGRLNRAFGRFDSDTLPFTIPFLCTVEALHRGGHISSPLLSLAYLSFSISFTPEASSSRVQASRMESRRSGNRTGKQNYFAFAFVGFGSCSTTLFSSDCSRTLPYIFSERSGLEWRHNVIITFGLTFGVLTTCVT